MGKQGDVPDAWEDDWETQADKIKPDDGGAPLNPAQPPTQAPQTKAERLAQHVEDNRKLWESACVPPRFSFTPLLSSR